MSSDLGHRHLALTDLFNSRAIVPARQPIIGIMQRGLRSLLQRLAFPCMFRLSMTPGGSEIAFKALAGFLQSPSVWQDLQVGDRLEGARFSCFDSNIQRHR